jgi:hypothetical protein
VTAFERFPGVRGFPQASTLEEATQPQPPQIACTALLAAAIKSAVDSNAFDHLDFSAAAIKSAFTHENLVKMGRNLFPGNRCPMGLPMCR